MHIDIVPNRASTPTVLLRESYRVGDKVKKRTLANLSSLSMDKVEAIRLVLKGEALVPVAELFETVSSAHHGHVQAVHLAMKQLGLEKLIGGSRPSRERDIVMAMVAARIVEPESKLATTRWWQNTTLPELFHVGDASEDDLYGAMDWLLARQGTIEKKLAARHLREGGLVLYDLSSSYFEGTHCPLAARGHNRDGKKGKLQVNYGLLSSPLGIPVAISPFAGNVADPQTVMEQVTKVREEFGIGEMVLVGDRGMISQGHIEKLRKEAGIDWITAMKSGAIRKLINSESLQLGLFDEKNLFEFVHPDYPGERLIACKNPDLAKLRGHKREALLEATVKELEKVRKMVEGGRLKNKGQIGLRVGKVINKYKMAKHINLEIQDTQLNWRIKEEKVSEERSLDGIYIIRTSLPVERMNSEDAVRSYKELSQVERAFRSMKSMDLEVRPIYHRLEKRVRAHLLLCMLSYYVKWHMMEAWRPVLFADEDKEAKKTRDPVAPARRGAKALQKVQTKYLDDGTVVHSFQTLLKSLSTIVRNECRYKNPRDNAPTFIMDTIPRKEQQRAFDLLATIRM
jgi:transposase